MRHDSTYEAPRHPIGVVASRTGIPQDLLRAWEKRYDAVVPGRSTTGRRLYSDHDIDKLRLLRRAVAAGRRISDVAGLTLDALRGLVQEDVESAPTSPAAAGGVSSEHRNSHLEEALDALEKLDKERLEHVLSDAAVSLSSPALRHTVIVPLLHTIGERWREGNMRIIHEHIATAIVRAFIEGRNVGRPKAPTAPKLLVTTPAGQRHELGALLAASAAEEFGWNVIYLGPDLPAEEIAAAARHFRPRAVALSVVYSNGNVQVLEEFRKLRVYLDPDVDIIVGGRAVSSFEPFLPDLGIRFVEDLNEFQDNLLTIGS